MTSTERRECPRAQACGGQSGPGSVDSSDTSGLSTGETAAERGGDTDVELEDSPVMNASDKLERIYEIQEREVKRCAREIPTG